MLLNHDVEALAFNANLVNTITDGHIDVRILTLILDIVEVVVFELKADPQPL